MSNKSAVELAAAFIANSEGLRKKAYPDPLRGWDTPTIGWGTTVYPDGTTVKKGDVRTREYLRSCLMHFIEMKCVPALKRIPTWAQMNDYQRAALISFGYNLGPYFYKAENRESITRLCDHPEWWDDIGTVCDTFAKYRNPGTNVENGLRKRRLMEANLFLMK